MASSMNKYIDIWKYMWHHVAYLLSVPQRPVPSASLPPARVCVTQQQTVASEANESKQIRTNPYNIIQIYNMFPTCWRQHASLFRLFRCSLFRCSLCWRRGIWSIWSCPELHGGKQSNHRLTIVIFNYGICYTVVHFYAIKLPWSINMVLILVLK